MFTFASDVSHFECYLVSYGYCKIPILQELCCLRHAMILLMWLQVQQYIMNVYCGFKHLPVFYRHD